MAGHIVLVNPLFRVGKGLFPGGRIVLPLGLISVAAPVDKAGYRVRIIDQQIDTDWRSDLFAALKEKPLCVGVTCMTGPQIRYAVEVSRLVKEHSDVPVVWGGSHPSLLPKQTLESSNVDIVVVGEGEESFLDLVRAVESGSSLAGVKGIWFKGSGGISSTPPRPLADLNDLPPPAYHLLPVASYQEKRFGNISTRMFTSRGCQYQCTFCYNLTFNRRSWRALSVEESIRRIKFLKEAWGAKGLILNDDNFFGDVERAREILERIVKEIPDVVLYKLDIRPDILNTIDDDFLKLIRKSGCISLSIGIESGSPRIMKMLKKKISPSTIRSINRRLMKADIIPRYTFMMGYPTETLEELQETVDLIRQLIRENLKATKSLHIYTPLPGTELFDLAVEHGLKVPQRLEDWAYFNYRNVNLPWLDNERRQMLEMLHFCTIFLEYNSFFNPLFEVHPFIQLLARIYRPVARWRVEKNKHQFLCDLRLAELLRLYPRQM
jgi:radical SAM superfamily enzyme YgiQ (UPF0313 family)